MTEKEKLEKYILLFGLREDFTFEELTASYRVLAKLNHPDVSRDKDSLLLMTTINEGHEFLIDAFSSGKIRDFFHGKKSEEEKEKAIDVFYNQYKKGFIILKNAFDDYYGESENKSDTGNTELLKRELMRAKIEFAVLINDLPYNQWVNDAIDKVTSINKWLD